MKKVNFIKMHGLGNDFVILDTRSQDVGNPSNLAKRLADRRFGVGCDQVIFLKKPDDSDVRMAIFNPDGSEAGMCGNAARCVADIILHEKKAERVSIEIGPRIVSCVRAASGGITVDMGEPQLEWSQIPLASEGDTRFVSLSFPAFTDPEDSESLPVCVSMGNPHCVFFIGKNVEEFPVSEFGPQIETNSLFPQKTNVEFAQVKSRTQIRMRVWERGTGVTLACGSGACATAVAAIRRGYTDRKVTIEMDGGSLDVEWRESDNHVYMTGPVAYVFSGETMGE